MISDAIVPIMTSQKWLKIDRAKSHMYIPTFFRSNNGWAHTLRLVAWYMEYAIHLS